MRSKITAFLFALVATSAIVAGIPGSATALPTPSPVITAPPTRVGALTTTQAPFSPVTALTTVSGDVTVTVDNTRIENKDITGKILIKANNVHVFNTKVHTTSHLGNGIEIFNGYVNAQLTNVTVVGFENSVAGGNYVATRLDVSGMEGDGFKLGDHTEIFGSYCHGVYVGSSGAHADCAQAQGSPIGGVNLIGNYFDAQGGNSAVTIAADLGPIVSNYSSINLIGNYFDGGNYTLKVANGSGGTYNNLNNIIAENRFGPHYTYGPEAVSQYYFYDFPTNVDNSTGTGV